MRASSKSWRQFYPHRIFVQNLRLKFQVDLFARQIAGSPHIGRASMAIMGVIVHFHPLAVHHGQPTTTELASQWPDLTVVYVKASQTRCFAFKDIFVLQFDGERRALAGQLVVRADALALYVVGLKAGWQLG